MFIESVRLDIALEKWPLKVPFRITGHSWEAVEVVAVRLEKDGCVGQGEGAGVYYRNDTPASMLKQLEELRPRIEAGLSRDSVQTLLAPGGARNALDCALWELEAKLSGHPVWEIAGLSEPRPLLTTFTCGADEPEKMAAAALAYRGARAIKLKLTGAASDLARVEAVRAALPDVWLGVDANQGFTRESLERLIPALLANRVALIEQPFPIGEERWLDGLASPIPVAADESVQGVASIPQLVGRVQMINIKLDKCGGLTEGLAMVRVARQLGLEPMVGNMMGTSLAMRPAFVVGQFCEVVDLDGPAFIKVDRDRPVIYKDGFISCPE